MLNEITHEKCFCNSILWNYIPVTRTKSSGGIFLALTGRVGRKELAQGGTIHMVICRIP